MVSSERGQQVSLRRRRRGNGDGRGETKEGGERNERLAKFRRARGCDDDGDDEPSERSGTRRASAAWGSDAARVVSCVVTVCPRDPRSLAPLSSEPRAGPRADGCRGDGLASGDGDAIHDGALAETVSHGLVPASVEVAALAAESDEERASRAPRGADHACAGG